MAAVRMAASSGGRADRARGYTLIELMMVVAVIAVIGAIAVPTYQGHVRKSHRGQAQADLVELAQRAERFHTVNNTYDGFWDTVPTGHRRTPREGTQRYTLAIADAAANTFTLSATPMGVQLKDQCGTLRIDQTGRKRHSAGTVSQCRFGQQGN